MFEEKPEGKEEKYDKSYRMFPEQDLFLFRCNIYYIKVVN